MSPTALFPRLFVPAFALLFAFPAPAEDGPIQVSGVYPHLRMWNDHGEAGTGAVVPWQGSLWAITYAPHMPEGSSDRLYQVTPELEQIPFDGSVGGTPANRMIHQESNQLLIGPYLIDAEKQIRVIPPDRMYGRLTGNARHLSDPENKVYYATMEEGLYEVDVRTLEVKALIRDGHGNAPEGGVSSQLPGYHGKGLYSGHGRVVYSNNGEKSAEARQNPTTESGALAEWFGEGDWSLVRRNQFTEVSGPGGIHGNANPETDPIWAMGWDAKSLLLALLDEKGWSYYRLPKASHSYDGAHGWNTEWPRIREIGEPDLLATMHGTLWRFPATFSRTDSDGIAPRSNYLKVIGDFCRWGDRIVFGCDDSAQSEFLNVRSFKAEHASPLQSNSNLWFVEPKQLDSFGPAIGRGSVWLREDLSEGDTSDPYLFSGFDLRYLHLVHGATQSMSFRIEVDREGTDEWTTFREITVPADIPMSLSFDETDVGAWVRLVALSDVRGVTAHFHYRDRDSRGEEKDDRFVGIATTGETSETTGLMRSLAYDRLGLVVPGSGEADEPLYYEVTPELEIVPREDPDSLEQVFAARQPAGSVSFDEASIILVEDGQTYRLPRNPDWVGGEEASPTSQEKTLAHHLPRSLTRDATVRSSETHEDYGSARAIDGAIDDESRWIGAQGEESWIELEFDSPRSIRSLWIASGWQKDRRYVARDFDVLLPEEDGWALAPGGEIRGNDRVEREIRFEEPIATERLRIESREDGFFRLYEIAAFEEVPDIAAAESLALGPEAIGPVRICREVATERDLLNVGGTFFELPARNAQGLAKVRPIASHPLQVQDFCSHNGLLFLTGIDASTESPHVFRSEDGKAAVWAGVVDDLWKLGKPRGVGGPWKNTPVKAGVPSDPYLMTGYDRKSYRIESSRKATVRLEVDIDGTGLWIPWSEPEIPEAGSFEGELPEAFGGYWVRAISDTDTTATVWFVYD